MQELWDVNMLLGCNNEEQMEKAKKMIGVGKVKVVRAEVRLMQGE